MGTVCVTGSAGGIGAATRAVLEAAGHTVVGVDLRDAEVTADLATPEGRAAMVAGVASAVGRSGALDGLVVGAGVQGAGARLVVGVNYFGAVATLEGLRPLLARSGDASAVVLGSNSATVMPGLDPAIAGGVRGRRRAGRGGGRRGGGALPGLPVDQAGPGPLGAAPRPDGRTGSGPGSGSTPWPPARPPPR